MLRSIDREKCIGCGLCFKSCSFDVYRLNTHQEKAAPCSAGCPAGTDMRSYLHLLQQGRHAEAAAELLQYNPLPLLTSRVCPHFCEKVCTRKKIDAAVNIPALEDYLGHWILDHAPALPDISRAGDIAVCYAETKKAERELGWKARRTVEEMCRDAWRFEVGIKL